jgi:hypothetical protein
MIRKWQLHDNDAPKHPWGHHPHGLDEPIISTMDLMPRTCRYYLNYRVASPRLFWRQQLL